MSVSIESNYKIVARELERLVQYAYSCRLLAVRSRRQTRSITHKLEALLVVFRAFSEKHMLSIFLGFYNFIPKTTRSLDRDIHPGSPRYNSTSVRLTPSCKNSFLRQTRG